MDRPTVFISYSKADKIWLDRLRTQLGVLEKQGRITLWDDGHFDPGGKWYPDIQAAMARAKVAVCLVSADYLNTDFVLREEIPVLLERQEKEGMTLIPVLIHPCAWPAVPWLEEIHMLPGKGQSVAVDFETKWQVVFADVAMRVFTIVDDPGYEPPPRPEPKWPPPEKVSIDRLPNPGVELLGRRDQLAMLDAAWDDAGSHVVSLVAGGGTGKSTLLRKWLDRLEADNYRGARRVFGWSFYSQGTGERVTSADIFVADALKWFGDPNPTAGSAWAKGERLADFVRRQKTLLLLDGMEPLQSPLAIERGKITDPALSALMAELARENPGLCVITTRESVTDIERFDRHVRQENLDQLSTEEGRALLRVGGVRGSDEELEKATRDFGHSALALNLLAAWLRDIPGHQIAQASEIPQLEISVDEGGHPRRVMAAFEDRFGEGPQTDLLRVLGLFERPADDKEIIALRSTAIAHLTDHLYELSDAEWMTLLADLRRTGLIAPESRHAPNDLDAHPLVREYFGKRLREEFLDAWREGHNRLYAHLTETAQDLAATLAEMMPLFQAVAHGCAAGRHQEAYDEVYRRRIARGNEFFSIKKLGAFGADLAALAGFFDSPWRKPVDGLTEVDKGVAISMAGFNLRALGRLREAVDPMAAGLAAQIERKDWKNVAIAAGNLSELHLTLGGIRQALKYARQGVERADKSGEAAEKIDNRSILANALHQAGRIKETAALFAEAEAMQKERQPEYPFLYSLQGYHYCDLLLEQGKHGDVIERASQTLEWAKTQNWLLDIALDHLSLGRANLLQFINDITAGCTEAETHLHQAVDGLRQTGMFDEIPRGLLARAELHRVRKDFDAARRDLDEAMSIAGRGEMRLFLADAHLEYARLHRDLGEKERAREFLATAREIIGKTGYHRRDGTVA